MGVPKLCTWQMVQGRSAIQFDRSPARNERAFFFPVQAVFPLPAHLLPPDGGLFTSLPVQSLRALMTEASFMAAWYAGSQLYQGKASWQKKTSSKCKAS